MRTKIGADSHVLKNLMDVSNQLSFGEYLNNWQGLPIVQNYITHIRQHQMVSYENKQTPFKKESKKEKEKVKERENTKERERERKGK